MGNHNRFISAIVFFLLICTGKAQTNPYIIFLKDKSGTDYMLSEPCAYLSPKSIQRRINQNIAIDSTDLPVSELYLNQIRSIGAGIIYSSRWLNAVYINADANQYAQVVGLPFVQSAIYSFRVQNEPNTHQIQGVTTVPYSNSFSDFLGITEMHQDHFTGDGVLIAITDSGFPGSDTLSAFKNVWNQNKIIYHWDVADNNDNVFNDDAHGTFVFSILAAQLPDYTGVAPDAEYILLRTEVASSETKLEEFHWLRAAEIADSCGADIISSSLGYDTFDNANENYTYFNMNGATSIIAQAANTAFDKGMLVVCSAGNEGNKPWKYITTPADAEHVLAIGSVNFDNTKSAFSSVGPSADGRIKPDLCATGNNIYGLSSTGSIHSSGGTSFSTPMVAGMAAGLKQAFPSLSCQELKDILIQSGDQYLHPDNDKGYGTLHYQKLKSVASLSINKASVILAPNPYESGDLYLKLVMPNASVDIIVTDIQGRIVATYSLSLAEEIVQLSGRLDMLAAGLYFFSIQTDMKKQVIKWIKL